MSDGLHKSKTDDNKFRKNVEGPANAFNDKRIKKLKIKVQIS